jgi:putative ABC transport system permease protein
MNTQIVVAGLRARPVRTAVGILAVTLEVVLILLLVGLTTGTIEETGNRVAGVGAEILVKDNNKSYILGMNAAVLPVDSLTADILAVPGVKATAPVITATDTGFTVVYGIEKTTFEAVSGGFEFIDGEWFSGPYEALIDNWQASKENLKVGEMMEIRGKNYKVTGIVQNGKAARIFIPMQTMQAEESREGWATLFYVKLDDNVETKEGIARLEKALAEDKYEVRDVNEIASLLFSSNASIINAVFDVVVFLGATIGILVIFLSMYTSVSERTREIGILRAMGSSKGFIVALVVQESLLLCALGAVSGIGLSYVFGFLLKKIFPTMIITITGSWVVKATLFALLSGVIGSLYPAYKAASQDPIEALAYE